MKEVVTAGLAAAVVIVSVKLQPVPPPLLALQLPVGGSVAGEKVAPDGRPVTATGSDPFPLPLMLMAYVTELDVPYGRTQLCANGERDDADGSRHIRPDDRAAVADRRRAVRA